MTDPFGEPHGFIGLHAGPLRKAVHPQQHPFDDVTDHSGIIAGLETLDRARGSFVGGDSAFQLVDRWSESGEHAFARSDHEMPLDTGPYIVEALGDRQELPTDPHGFLE